MAPLETRPDPARRVFDDLQAEVARLQRIIQLKDEQIQLLNFRLFGPKSEKLSSAQLPLLLAMYWAITRGWLARARARRRRRSPR